MATDAEIASLAGAQFNRMARWQLRGRGLTDRTVDHLIGTGRFVIVEHGVLAVAPVLRDHDWGRWMAATLTAPGTVLSHISAAAAWGFWSLARRYETVTRAGNGGPRRHGGLLVYRSSQIDSEITKLRGIPITSVPRTIVDLAAIVSERALARAVREAIRLELTTPAELTNALRRYRGRRGVARLAATLARYSGLPIERARSGAEVRALEVIRDADRAIPRLNVKIAGEEADLSWADVRLIIEIDGGPFHLDLGEDARKEAAWTAAGWNVRRIPADDVYERPYRLLELAPTRPT